MDTKIGKQIGEGGCSEIFEWQDSGKIIKLAKANTDREAISREYYNNCIAWNIGLSVAQPFELVDIDGRPGIVIERIHGETLMERFMKQSLNREEGFNELKNGARITARILKDIHKQSDVKNMPSQKDRMKYGIRLVDYLNAAEKEAVITLLDDLPMKEQLCHGDPNPGNIILRNNKAVIIDWNDASIGNPEADLAEYIVMIRYAILPPQVPNEAVEYFDSIREQIIEAFLSEYMTFSAIDYNDIDAWIAPVAARKLCADAISDAEKNILVKEIRKRL